MQLEATPDLAYSPRPMAEPAIEIRDLEVRSGGRTILSVPSFTLVRGEILALLGPNGAGKTTLIHSMALLSRTRSGEVIVLGEKPPRDPTPLRRRMAVVFQEPLLLGTTVRGNVASGLAFRGAACIDARVDRALALFGIAHLADRSARRLSGGESARVSLARAFVLEPEIMMLDEPFSSLDAPTRLTLLDEVESVLRRTRVTTVMATHDASEALRLAGRIAVMCAGRIVQVGPTAEVMERPADETVARLVGVETILSGRVVSRSGPDALVSVAGREIRARTDAPPGEEVVLCIRPEAVTLSPGAAEDALHATVTRIVPMLHHAKIHVDAGFDLCASVVQPADLAAGSLVTASIDPAAIHVIRRTS